jgi:hypothetical protein
MSEHDPTYGGLLMSDDDRKSLDELLALYKAHQANASDRARRRELLESHLHRLEATHPETLCEADWRSMRIGYILALRCQISTIPVLNDLELDGVTQRLEVAKARGLLGATPE